MLLLLLLLLLLTASTPLGHCDVSLLAGHAPRPTHMLGSVALRRPIHLSFPPPARSKP